MAAAKTGIDTTPGTRQISTPSLGAELHNAFLPGQTPLPTASGAGVAGAKGTSAAEQSLIQTMELWGMPADLATWAWQQYTQIGGSISDALPIIQTEVYNQPSFQARFPAYKPLAAQGDAPSVASMLSYEDTAKQYFEAAGLPKGFYDTPDQLAPLMVSHVGLPELQSRVQLAQQAATTAPPDVIQQLKSLYGLDQGHLTAYYLNPDKALPLLQAQFAGAQIGAEATRTGVGQLSADQANHLAAIGVTDAQAAQGFGQLGTEQGLFQQQVQGEAGIDLNTQIAATFDNSAAAQLRIQRAQQARLAAFQGNAGEQLGSTGVGGLGRTDKSIG